VTKSKLETVVGWVAVVYIHIEELKPLKCLEQLPKSSMEECLDDSDIPSRLVIQHALGTTISETEGSANMSELKISAAKLGDSGGLVAAMDEENIWAWNWGEKWGDKPPTVADDR
jgi:hypothetical protein